MASRTDSTKRIEVDLDLLTADVADLDTTLQEWDRLSDVERLAFEMEWRLAVQKLDTLSQLRDNGVMSHHQTHRHDQILSALEPHINALMHRRLAVPEQFASSIRPAR